MKTTIVTNSFLRYPLFALAAAVFTFSSCSKSNSNTPNDVQNAEDQANVTTALNSASDDAGVVVGTNHATAKTAAAVTLPCNATIDASDSLNKKIIITYTGQDCYHGLTRSGTITYTLTGGQWSAPGAVLTMTFDNVKYTNSIGKSITINGTHYLTNVTGGLAWQVVTGDTTAAITHKQTATNLTITFDDGSQRTWSVHRLRTYSNIGTPGISSVSISSDSAGGLDTWGTTRFGETFTNTIVTTVVANSNCGYYKPIAGDYNHHVASRDVDILFGLDGSGNPVSAGSCATDFKVTYTAASGHSTSLLVSYPY